MAESEYELALTNLEVEIMFRNMVKSWFRRNQSDYNDFIKALLKNDLDAMNAYMNRVALATFSYFDTGKNSSEAEPERFYHGFVLGLMVELSDCYVMLEPLDAHKDAFILEFKVFQPQKERELFHTVQAALEQIEEKKYETLLVEKGFSKQQIRKYGFAFCGKKVLIGS